MIITRTPYRISFFGGGTDLPVHYREHGGAVLSTTINKYCYITCRHYPPFFSYRHHIRYSQTELVQSVDEIQHPSVRECFRFMGMESGIEMVHAGDIPARSGIGSSSSFTVGLLHALYALRGEMVTRRKLAMDAIHVEQNMIGENVGSQDQTAAAFGGFNMIEFDAQREIWVTPVTIDAEKLAHFQSHLMFFFTGLSRDSSKIAAEQVRLTPEKCDVLKTMRAMVDDALSILSGPTDGLEAFGDLLHESWMLKRKLSSQIANAQIDEMYEAGKKAGALGGKLCGAGGGGFLLLFVPPERQERVRESLKDLLLVPMSVGSLGSHVIFYAT